MFMRWGGYWKKGLTDIFSKYDEPFHISRIGSAFCVYFMDHAPRDFHDIAIHHNFTLDKTYRLKLIEAGIFIFPLPVKQGSISFAHSISDIEETLDKTRSIVQSVFIKKN